MEVELPEIVERLRPLLATTKITHRELQAIRLELGEARVEALKILQEKRRQMLWPKDKDLTEMDRKIRLDADCAPLERNYELLLKLEEIVRDKIEIDKLYKR